ncbi:MAG: HAD hydrolase-like protein [Rhizobiaceae bacterium]|nr:HAD hydrolase-like protein [Rhizobiaceae bacterium]
MAVATVLFDLDGTLTDPFEGITRSLQYALERMGRIPPAAEYLRWCVGPPLQANFRELLATDDKALIARAVELYRERYNDVGKFENVLIDGIPELLARLRDDGYALAVATSKLQSYAGDIVEHFGLMPYFDTVYGSEPDGRYADKADLIGLILKLRKIEPGRTLMIGDRMHDIVGAKKNSVRGIGVLWGYGDEDELTRAGADDLADTPERLGRIIRNKLPMN